jgi:DNA-binding transcriptional MerR regulator
MAARVRTTAPTEAAHLRKLLKIGDFARSAGTNLRTLRYYEELGLLPPAERSEGGFRYYRPTDIHRLKTIRSLQDLGLPLDEIRTLLGTQAPGRDRTSFCASVRRALEVQDQLLVRRREAIEAQRAVLAQALNKLSQCEVCAFTPGPHNNRCEPCSRTGETLPEGLSALY